MFRAVDVLMHLARAVNRTASGLLWLLWLASTAGAGARPGDPVELVLGEDVLVGLVAEGVLDDRLEIGRVRVPGGFGEACAAVAAGLEGAWVVDEDCAGSVVFSACVFVSSWYSLGNSPTFAA